MIVLVCVHTVYSSQTSCMVCTNVSALLHRFIVPEDKIQEFEETWQERESVMQQMPGFKGFTLEQTESSDFVTTSRHACITRLDMPCSQFTCCQCLIGIIVFAMLFKSSAA